MKKILIAAVNAAIVLSMAGCMPNNAEQLENLSTADAPKADTVKSENYENNLSGLEKYFMKLQYIPENTEPTEMVYGIIGAVDGDRYIFNVNSSRVIMELYEYEPDQLGDEGKRVISEVQKTGKFHVFEKSSDNDRTYDAYLSDNNKYLMIYTDSSESIDNIERKDNAIALLKSFDGGKKTS